MKMRELFLILLLAAALTYVTRPFFDNGPKETFATRHPVAAKVFKGAVRVAKTAGIYFLFAEDKPAPQLAKEDERLYADDPARHFSASNQPAIRPVGADGFPVISHGNGW